MTSLRFTVDHDHTYNDDEQLIGWVTASCGTRPGDFRVRVLGGATPRTINLPARKGYLAADGHMYEDETLAEPFRLTANDPAFNLRELTYRFDFDLTTLLGVPVQVPSCYGPAPSTDTTLYLTKLMNDVDQPVIEVRTKGYAQDILDATNVGVGVITSDDPEAARDVLDAAGGFSSAADGQDTAINGGKLTARNPLYIDPTQAPYNIKMDGKTSTAASMSSSTNPTQLTVTGYTFTAADVGKVIKVVGAGSAGGNLKTAITGTLLGKAVLGSPCLTTVSDAFCIFGTDNADGLDELFSDLSYRGPGRKLSRIAVFPMGVCMYSGTVLFPLGGTVKGASENWQDYFVAYGNSGNGVEDGGATLFYQIWDQNVDAARVRAYSWNGDWVGVLDGFGIMQDADNTVGRGLSFRDADGVKAKIADGGTVNRIAVFGAANQGIDFAGGTITATFRDVYAFACGYEGRKDFTANTTIGSSTISNVSDTTGLAFGDIVTGAGIPTDTTITSVNSGAGTVNLSAVATATATGVNVQKLGDPGILYSCSGAESVHFDGPSGDQNSGGLLRLKGLFSTQTSAITITNLKNEYGTNVYREDRLDTVNPGDPSVPQGLNAIVIDAMGTASISIRGLIHWADASSSVGGTYPNTLGRDIGAAILVLPTGSAAPVVTWEALKLRFAAGSGQTSGYALRDNHASTILPIAHTAAGRGTNRPIPKLIRTVSDAATTISVHDEIVEWSSLTASRTGTLPAISAVAAGTVKILEDGSGSASADIGITAVTSGGSDVIVGDTTIATGYGALEVHSDGTRWIGRLMRGSRASVIRDSSGNTAIAVAATSNAVNYLQVANADTGNPPQVRARGTDTHVGVMLRPQANGGVQVYAETGITARVTAVGVDSTIDLNVQSKAGRVLADGNQVQTRSITTLSTSSTLGAVSGHRYIVLITAGGAPTLPTAVSNNATYVLKNIDTADHAIATTSAQTIEGSTLTLTRDQSVELVSDGSNWRII